MKRKHFSQKMYLFFSYGTLTLVLICAFFAYFYWYYSNNIYTEAEKKSADLCTSVNSFVSANLDTMSTLSMNIVYTNSIRNKFKDFSESEKELENEDLNSLTIAELQMQRRDSKLEIFQHITAMVGSYQTVSQVNLYTLDGTSVGSGYFERVQENLDLEHYQWYHPTIELNGYKYISTPIHHGDIPAEGENFTSHQFLSLTRVFLDESRTPEGIVEIIQDCNEIFSLIPELKENNPGASIYVYNDRHELVYPYRPEDAPQHNYLPYLAELGQPPLTPKMATLKNQEEVLLTYKEIENYNWTIITAIPRETIFASLKPFKNSFFIIIIVVILCILALCLIISNRLTYPLRALTKTTQKITLNRVLDETQHPPVFTDSYISEISLLCNSFSEMYDKLKLSSQAVLLAHSEEIKAKVQATQSLINPHFLYNSLTSISVMAEEEMNEEIILICQSLCEYFRYISDSSKMIVPLSQEISYTEKYINCMKIKFEHEFSYTCDIEDEARELLIPKLIIQPLVENAFKYAYNTVPPWTLRITARIESDNWIVEVEDNGGSLSNEKKAELLHQYAHLNQAKEINSLHIGGMGLKNACLRLKLLYGEQAIFRIKNNHPKRTVFIIGGPLYQTEEIYYEQHPHF